MSNLKLFRDLISLGVCNIQSLSWNPKGENDGFISSQQIRKKLDEIFYENKEDTVPIWHKWEGREY